MIRRGEAEVERSESKYGYHLRGRLTEAFCDEKRYTCVLESLAVSTLSRSEIEIWVF